MVRLIDQRKNEFRGFMSFSYVLPVVLALILIILSQLSFLLYHSLAEVICVIIAVLMTVVSWQMYPVTKNNYLMYIGTGYFWVGALDLAHVFAYGSINVIPGTDGNTAAQIWVMTRLLEAVILITAPLFLDRRLNKLLSFSVFGAVAIITGLMIYGEIIPVSFIEEKGLTDFKIYTEYLVIALLVAGSLFLWSRRKLLDIRLVKIMITAMLLTMCAEVAFTLYVTIFGLSNIVGHIFKFFSFWLIFIAMIKISLQEPFVVLSRGANTYDAIPDATVLVGLDGLVYQVNQAACRMSGKSKSELIGGNNHDLFHPDIYEEKNCPVCNNIARGSRIHGFEMEVNNRWVDYSLSPVLDEKGEVNATVEVVRDISRRKQVEQALDDVNELKNSIVDNLPAMLFVKTAEDQRYVEWNKAAEELTGLSREEMLGKNDYDFFTEDEADFYIGMDKKVIAEGVLHDIPEEPIHTREKGVRLLHTRKIPIFNKQGEASYLLGISQDITEKKATEEMLRRSQKMEAVGQLSGGIAHDFNNQLGIITGYLEFLKAFVKDHEKQKVWVENASRAAKRCVELTRQLLIFSRAKSGDIKQTNMNEVIKRLEDVIARSVTPEVNVEYKLEPGIWPVTINSGELEDAIVNMVINSRDAMPDGGEVLIRTANVYLDSDFMVSHPTVSGGYYSMLEIRDTGEGIERSLQDKIFEPFFTTKAVGKGTGLGLSMVYAFIERNDGVIKVESETGKGTSIKIYLPRDNELPIESDGSETALFEIAGGDETLLLVDDEVDLLELTRIYLEDKGYKVLVAENAKEALEILEHERVDLLFSDIVMPGGMNGFELAEKVSALYPGVKLLLTSGFAGKETINPRYKKYMKVLLTKPYTRHDILDAIRHMIDSGKLE